MGFVNNNNTNNYGCSGYGYEVPQPLLKQDCHLDNCVINRTDNNNGIGLYWFFFFKKIIYTNTNCK